MVNDLTWDSASASPAHYTRGGCSPAMSGDYDDVVGPGDLLEAQDFSPQEVQVSHIRHGISTVHLSEQRPRACCSHLAGG